MAKAKTTKKIEELFICGKSEGVIRKAYFEKMLPALLDEIQAEGKSDKGEIEKLGFYLQTLKDDNTGFVDDLQKAFGGKIIDNATPPSVDDLRDGMSDKSWREKADKAIDYIESTLDCIRGNITERKSFAADFWGNTAMIFLSMQSVLEKDLIFKRQLYKAKLTKIIDDFGTSRKEAEERAELTKDYFDYRTLDKLLKRLEEFYTFARRRDDETNHR